MLAPPLERRHEHYTLRYPGHGLHADVLDVEVWEAPAASLRCGAEALTGLPTYLVRGPSEPDARADDAHTHTNAQVARTNPCVPQHCGAPWAPA